MTKIKLINLVEKNNNGEVITKYNIRDFHVFDQTEKIVGSWFGKLLYERTITETLPTISNDGTFTAKYITLNQFNVDFVFLKKALLIDSKEGNSNLPYTTNGGLQTKALIQNNNITLTSNCKDNSGKTCYLIINYTKK